MFGLVILFNFFADLGLFLSAPVEKTEHLKRYMNIFFVWLLIVSIMCPVVSS